MYPHPSIRLAFALLAAALTGAHAADLRVSSLALAPSGSGSLRLDLSGVQPVVGVQIDLVYPASELALGTPQGGAALDNHVLKSAEIAPGRRRFLVYSGRNQILRGGTVVEIPVTHIGASSTGTFPIVLTNAIVATPAALAERPLNVFSSEFVLGGSGPPSLSAVSVGIDGRIRFLLEGADGETYQIEGSMDLRTWIDLLRLTLTGTQVAVEDLPPAGLLHGFYRARLVR